jgi:ribosomal protein S18 acetylase RimI-like enzyme
VEKSLGVTKPAVSLRILTADDWLLFRDVRLEALREAAYAFGSTLDDWQREKDTEDRWRQRLTDVPFNVIAYFGGTPSGMVSATKPNADGAIELISMWVAPFARGKGVADLLVDAVIRWATAERITKVSLDVIEDNGRARAFYHRHGFIDQGRNEISNGTPERRMLRVSRRAPGDCRPR